MLKDEQNSSITNFTTLFEDYRTLVNRKGQHIHPMLYEDLTQQFNRAILETIPKLKIDIIKLHEIKKKLEQENDYKGKVIV